MTGQFDFRHTGYCEICEKEVEFHATQNWFRDHLACPRCQSVPRERALMHVLKRYYPNYRKLKIHESSPIGRGVTTRLVKECRNYSYSHYFPDTPPGEINKEFQSRCENLEALTFPDASFDLIISQDVMEHVFDPDAAFREIARVLKSGGAHIFTVPIVRKTEASRRRATLNENGEITYHLEAEYHGNPIDDQGSLVTMDWGYDIVRHIHEASGLGSQIIFIDDIDLGIRAEYIDVVITLKR